MHTGTHCYCQTPTNRRDLFKVVSSYHRPVTTIIPGLIDRSYSMRLGNVRPESVGESRNWTGLTRARDFAFNRHIEVGTMAGISEDVEGQRINAGEIALPMRWRGCDSRLAFRRSPIFTAQPGPAVDKVEHLRVLGEQNPRRMPVNLLPSERPGTPTVLMVEHPPNAALSLTIQYARLIAGVHSQGHRLLVIVTSSLHPMLTDPSLTPSDAELRMAVELFCSTCDFGHAVGMLRQVGISTENAWPSIRIKRLFCVIEMARQVPETVVKLLMSSLIGFEM
ncbi:hypothetical protein H4582DRAFT_2084378 [Lactarius indigo]|nr:hypothetical protein H4582DRAFT_2084378 [Lactarius indigo]